LQAASWPGCAQAFVYVTAEFGTEKHELNQALIWSKIIEHKKDALLKTEVASEFPYALTDPGDSHIHKSPALSE
jgi:hypothetical protein